MKVEPKAQRERRIFEWFASAAKLELLGEVEQPDPPDIIVAVAGQGRVAFELVCVDAKSEFFAHEKFRKTDDAMERGWAALPQAMRERMGAKFADAEINIQLPTETRWKDISLQGVWEALDRLPASFIGDVPCSANVADSLYIYRDANHVGPTFSTLSGGWVPNISLSAIENKFAKKYALLVPLELLAYSHFHDIAHRSDYDAVEALARAKLRASSFRKLWLFDGMLRKIDLSVALTDGGPGGGFKTFRAYP